MNEEQKRINEELIARYNSKMEELIEPYGGNSNKAPKEKRTKRLLYYYLVCYLEGAMRGGEYVLKANDGGFVRHSQIWGYNETLDSLGIGKQPVSKKDFEEAYDSQQPGDADKTVTGLGTEETAKDSEQRV